MTVKGISGRRLADSCITTRIILGLIFLLGSNLCLGQAGIKGQTPYNRWEKITVEEFLELKKQKEAIIPRDIKEHKVLVVGLSKERFTKLYRDAIVRSLLYHNIDTTIHQPDSIFLNIIYRHESEKEFNRWARSYVKSFARLSIKAKFVTDANVAAMEVDKYKYSLNFDFLAEFESDTSGGEFGTIVYFLDRATGRTFEPFYPKNRGILELLF